MFFLGGVDFPKGFIFVTSLGLVSRARVDGAAFPLLRNHILKLFRLFSPAIHRAEVFVGFVDLL